MAGTSCGLFIDTNRHLCVIPYIFLALLSIELSMCDNSTEVCDMRPSDPEPCPSPPLFCKHGICKKAPINSTNTGLISGHSYSCECFEGWQTRHCDVCCDLPCQNGECKAFKVGVAQKPLLICRCAKGFTGEFCETELCLKHCNNNGTCKFENGTQVCDCINGYFGDTCDMTEGKRYTVGFWIGVGIVIFLFLALLIVVVIMPYVMWKKRALIVLKVHYYFQKYEDDDLCRYDAFISYSNKEDDADFVQHKLLPGLEDIRGFTLCVSERNFVPGAARVDNIVSAIKQSRRTILVITPGYLRDEWPIFEALTAQLESLSTAHRIIPIVFHEVEVDHPTLNNILSSLRCIQWPQEGTEKQMARFWKSLSYSMPKLKKERDKNLRIGNQGFQPEEQDGKMNNNKQMVQGNHDIQPEAHQRKQQGFENMQHIFIDEQKINAKGK